MEDFYSDLTVLQVNNFKDITTEELPMKERLNALAYYVTPRKQIKHTVSTPVTLIHNGSLSSKMRWIGAVDLTGFNLFPCPVHFCTYEHEPIYLIWQAV